MKIFWKIFFAFTTVIPLLFGVFGYILISRSFQDSYELEVEDCKKECRTFWLTFEMNLQVVDEEEITGELVADMAETLVKNLDYKTYDYTVYDSEGGVIYSRWQLHSEVPQESGEWKELLENGDKQKLVWQMYVRDGKNYLRVVCGAGHGKKNYYLETVKDITRIYVRRDELIRDYQILLVALLVCTVLLTLILSHLLSRNIVKLSQVTRAFTAGDYSVRADVRDGDETGRLAEDFNHMGDALVEKMEELTDAARRQEEFSASFAHELKTPMTSIIGYADMLRTMEMPEQERMETADYIFRQGKRLESLSRKLLELIVTGQEEITLQNIQSSRLAAQIAILVTPTMEEKAVEFTTDVEEYILWGDNELLVSLIANLLDNARKAVEQGGHITLQGRTAEGGYCFCVEDDGMGMQEEEIRHLTEPFYRVDKSRARKYGGAGLGLALCQRIVSLHEGKLEIRSEQGEGTRVFVTLPARHAGESGEEDADV